MIPAVPLSPAPHMSPGCISAVSVSIWSRLMSVMSVVSGWAPVSNSLTKAATVLWPGMMLLTVLVPAMLSRPDSAFIHSSILSLMQPFVCSFACWLVHSWVASFVQCFIPACIHSHICSSIDCILCTRFRSCIEFVHPPRYLFTPLCNRYLPMGSGTYSPVWGPSAAIRVPPTAWWHRPVGSRV